MIEQVSTSVKFLAFFTASKTGKTGLTVTIDIYDPSGTQIVTGGSATAIGGGLYSYTLSTNNSAEGEYAAIFKTTDSTVDSQHIPSLWVLGRAGVENLDAATSTRLPSSSYTAPANSDITAIKAKTDALPSDPADQSLVEAAITALSIPTVAQIRSELDSNSTKLANLDATVSSRLAPNGTLATVTTLTNSANVPSAAAIADEVRVELATELGRIDAPVSGATAPSAATVATAVRSELATELARVDVATSTRLATSGYTAPPTPPTAAANATAVRTELATELARVDVATSTRLASSAYTAPSNSDVTAIKAKTDLLETTRLAQCSTVATTGAQLAAALS